MSLLLDEKKQAIVSAIRNYVKSTYSREIHSKDFLALDSAVENLPLRNLDDIERFIRNQFDFARYEIAKSRYWESLWNEKSLLCWIDLCNRDGFRREKALHALSGYAPNSFIFAIALRRLNDWVENVREAAREQIPLIARQSNSEDVVSVLWAILPHITSWGRIESNDHLVFQDIFGISAILESLKTKIIESTSGPVTEILTYVGRTDVIDKNLLEIANMAIQPVVRVKAYRCLFENKITWVASREWEWTDFRYCKGRLKSVIQERQLSVRVPTIELLEITSSDRSPKVRKLAGEKLIKEIPNLGKEAHRFAELLAADKTQSVAERGQFALKKLEKD